MKIQLGFIGTGNMGGALARAAARIVDPKGILLSNRTFAKAEKLAEAIRCGFGENERVFRESRFLVFGVKPQMMQKVLAEAAPHLKERQERGERFILVTMAAGISMEKICQMAGGMYPVIRIMPNTPCSIGKGVVISCRSAEVSDEEYAEFKAAFSEAGEIVDLPENLMDAGCAVSGCGPAFAYMFMEAMNDAAVALGIPKDAAQKLSAATVLGSSEMVLQTGKHPAELRGNVCSPGGATIKGVLQLEKDGFRAAVEDCIRAAYDRTVELGK